MRANIRAQSTVLTTIIVVIMLIVALSTATYAWFSANNVVDIADIEFYAASSSGEGDLAISWTSPQDVTSFSIAFGVASAKMKPMMPVNAPFGGESYSDFVDAFSTSIMTTVANEDGTASQYYKKDGSACSPYTCCNPDDVSQTSFYVINLHSAFGMDVAVGYEMTGALKDKLKVAVFVEGKLAGVIGGGNTVYYGTIKKDTPVTDTASVANILYETDKLFFHLEPSGNASVTFVSWYDGVSMTDSDANGSSTLASLMFTGTYTQ